MHACMHDVRDAALRTELCRPPPPGILALPPPSGGASRTWAPVVPPISLPPADGELDMNLLMSELLAAGPHGASDEAAAAAAAGIQQQHHQARPTAVAAHSYGFNVRVHNRVRGAMTCALGLTRAMRGCAHSRRSMRCLRAPPQQPRPGSCRTRPTLMRRPSRADAMGPRPWSLCPPRCIIITARRPPRRASRPRTLSGSCAGSSR